MDLSSKDYDRIRVGARRRGRRAGPAGRASPSGGSDDGGVTAQVESRECAWSGCKAQAEYRAPKGRGKEGQYHWFCLDHVREYNKNYNYFAGMTDDDVIAYQRDAITGHRPTRPMGVRGGRGDRGADHGTRRWTGAYDDPFGLFGDGQPFEPRPEAPESARRRPRGPEREALEVMGLPENPSREAIKSRYKTLVKRHHPDANQGDRSSEDRLRSVINAYGVLRRAGYC